jgi:large-conductance mechanosensitive channel
MPKNGGAGLLEDVGKKGLGAAEDVASMGFKGVSGTVGKFRKTVVENKGIAVGLMVGIATLSVIHGIVNDLFMPLLAPLLGDVGAAEWSEKELSLGPVKIRVGSLLSAFMNYFLTIIAIYIFIHALE